MSHEGRMRRGKEETERKLDTADTRYFAEQKKAGNQDTELTVDELRKKEKQSLIRKIKGVFKSKKSSKEKEEKIKEAVNA